MLFPADPQTPIADKADASESPDSPQSLPSRLTETDREGGLSPDWQPDPNAILVKSGGEGVRVSLTPHLRGFAEPEEVRWEVFAVPEVLGNPDNRSGRRGAATIVYQEGKGRSESKMILPETGHYFFRIKRLEGQGFSDDAHVHISQPGDQASPTLIAPGGVRLMLEEVTPDPRVRVLLRSRFEAQSKSMGVPAMNSESRGGSFRQVAPVDIALPYHHDGLLFEGLDPRREYAVQILPSMHVGGRVANLRLAAGEVIEVQLKLKAGGFVIGTLLGLKARLKEQ